MADPIKVEVPKNAVEAQELVNKLKTHANELNSFLDKNEDNWNAEAEAKFAAMQADEAAMDAAHASYVSGNEAKAERRQAVNDSKAKFEALLSTGNSREQRDRLKDQFSGDRDEIDSMSDREVQDLALQGFVCELTERPMPARVQEARGFMNQMFKGNDTWKSKAVTLYQVEDDTVRDFQNRFFLNTLGVANPSGTASGSGSKLFNTSFVTTLEEARLAYGGMNAVADIMTTNSGEKIVWPTIDDTGNPGTVVAESAAVSTVEPTFSEVTWGAYKLTSGRIKITRELVEDNQTNLLSRIATLLGQRLGRVENTLFTNGTGSSQPTGLMTVVPTGTTGSLPTGIIFDELIDLEHSIDPSRRSSMCSYMLADNTFKLIRKLKDGNSNYLYQATANSGAPSTLNNYRYTINQDMPAVAASAKSIVFGDMKAFKIRRVRGMRLVVTDELYSETDEIGFFAWVRVDSNLLDAGDNPIACFAHAAA
mgnify:CR=1 FL=1